MRRRSRSSRSGQAATRRALIEAAAEVFARKGFAAATVREICLRAGANIAAVNYHFGDKEHLYAEVLHHTMRATNEKYPSTLDVPPTAPARDRLRAFIQSFLLRLFDESPQSWHGPLMAREMTDPTTALDSLVQQELRPRSEELHEIIGQLLAPAGTSDQVRLCAMSVVSQCIFYRHCRPVLERMFPNIKLGMNTVPALAEHITAFSLGGIKATRATAGTSKSTSQVQSRRGERS